jgi:hypothetical protein
MVVSVLYCFKKISGKSFMLWIVPCYKRCKQMEAMEVKETIIDEGDEEGGWVETQFEQDPTVTATQEKVADMSLDGKSELKRPFQTNSKDDEDDDDDDEEAADMEGGTC